MQTSPIVYIFHTPSPTLCSNYKKVQFVLITVKKMQIVKFVLPLSVDRRIAMNFAPVSLDEDFLPSAKASRLPMGVKVIRGIL